MMIKVEKNSEMHFHFNNWHSLLTLIRILILLSNVPIFLHSSDEVDGCYI
jgi:hypothetical protein